MTRDQEEKIIQSRSTFVEGYGAENDIVTPEVSNSPDVVVENLEGTSEKERVENDAAESKKKVVSKGIDGIGFKYSQEDINEIKDLVSAEKSSIMKILVSAEKSSIMKINDANEWILGKEEMTEENQAA